MLLSFSPMTTTTSSPSQWDQGSFDPSVCWFKDQKQWKTNNLRIFLQTYLVLWVTPKTENHQRTGKRTFICSSFPRISFWTCTGMTRVPFILKTLACLVPLLFTGELAGTSRLASLSFHSRHWVSVIGVIGVMVIVVTIRNWWWTAKVFG